MYNDNENKVFNGRKYFIPFNLNPVTCDYSYSQIPETHEHYDVSASVQYVGFFKWSYRNNRAILLYNVLPEDDAQVTVYVVDKAGYIFHNDELVWADRFTIFIGCNGLDGMDLASSRATIYREKRTYDQVAATREDY